MRIVAVAFVGLLASAPLQAQERPFCADRPGIGTPACTMASGAAAIEIGIAGWNLERDMQQRSDTFQLADTLVRYGIADHAEVQLGWTSLGLVRERDRIAGTIEHRSGTGDITLAVRRNLANPDGTVFSIAVMPFLSLPVGKAPIGAGDWGAGVHLPLSTELSESTALSATTIVEAAVDDDEHGRHLAVHQIVGATVDLADSLSATAEYEFLADRTAHDHHLEHLSGLSLAWQPRDGLQFDLGANLGLDHDSQDAEVYVGIAKRF